MRRSLSLLWLLPACNWAFGLEPTQPSVQGDADLRPDLDDDQLADEDDPCIAAPGDLTGDLDGDTIVNADDACPMDRVIGGDADGDGVPDTCDPFRTLDDDHPRCVMMFRNPDLNRALWRVRPGDVPWSLDIGLHSPSGETSTLLANATLEAPTTTTIDVQVLIALEVPAPTSAAFTAWVRAGDPASITDVGCEISGGATSTRVAVIGPGSTSSQTVNVAFQGGFRLRATVEPGAAPGNPNLRCSAFVFDGTGVVVAVPPIAAAVPLPSGNFGFTAMSGTAVAGLSFGIYGLATFDRPDAPALP